MVTAAGCSVCGLTFLNPMMTEAAYGDFYSRVYRPLVSAYHGRLINAQTIQDEQVEYARALGAFVQPWIEERRIQTLLDIGGSTGVVAREVSKMYSLEAAVLDPAANELDWAAKFGMETITGFLEQYDSKGRQFDFVTLCQTIDHLTDSSGSLRKIRQLLSPEGLFFVDIVDFRAAYLRQASVEGAVKIDHPYYFTEETVEAMLRRSGFSVLQKSYAVDHLHVGYICAPGEACQGSLPTREAVREFFREVRFIQNARL
jgi:SAM-dependent methyltransferase